MEDGVEDTRSLASSLDDDEDFGYVPRDHNLLEKVLNVGARSSAGSEGVTERGPEVLPSGDDERQPVDNSEASDTDVAKPSSSLGIDNDESIDVARPTASLITDSDDGRSASRKQGAIVNTPTVAVEFKHVYDASKRRTTVIESKEEEIARQTKGKRPSGLLKKMATKSITTGIEKEELPQTFQVKYLGYRDARGLWGIKHTRRPVDAMVAAAKTLKVGTVLPLVKLVVARNGVAMYPVGQKNNNNNNNNGVEEGRVFHPIETISYGVQDLVYTRVFSMIVVKDAGGNAKDIHPFECHGFVCGSRHGARSLTYSLATAFQEYSKAVGTRGTEGKDNIAKIKKRFAIDLRSPEEIEADLKDPQGDETEA